jgi:folate-dependent phosphoribosylglycinamide formyltransferase PurN
LVQEFGPFPAVIESHVLRLAMLRNRFRKLRLSAVLAQVSFVVLIRPVLNYFSKRRISQICRLHGIERAASFSTHIIRVDSANGDICQNFLTEHKPEAVIVNGTRILRSNILNATDAVFINTRQGITPLYRGPHGAYWSLFQGDPEHCGVTVHLVDSGVDTENIIGQTKIAPQTDDSFATYP